MKKLWGFVVSFLLLSFLSVMVVHAGIITPTPVDVTLISYFDAENHPTTTFTGATAKTYGATLSLSGDLESQSGYEFAFWIVNGVVRRDLAVDATFVMTDGLNLKAVFHPTSPLKYAVAFLDSNGQLIDLQYVASGGNAVAPSTTTLSKPGYTQSGWSVPYTNVTANIATVLKYTVTDPAANLTLTVTNGTGSGSYAFNTVATVTPNDRSGESTPMYFDGWENGNGVFISCQSTYSFSVLESMTLTARYRETSPIVPVPLVTLSDKFSFRSGKTSFLGQFYVPTGYSLVEFGTLVSDSNTYFDLSTGVSTKRQATKYFEVTNEWLTSVSATDGEYIKAYMVVENTSSHELFSYHSAPRAIKDLLISEYGEGSGNNKWIELFNPSAYAVDLGAFSLKQFADGSASATAELGLSGTLASGDVYVIALPGANATILGAADLTNAFVNFTGDDALGLYHYSDLIDQFGVIGTDPGTSWTVGTGTTEDHTLVRITNLDCPNATFNTAEWTVYEVNTTSYIGYQASDINYAISFNSNGGSAVSAISQNAGTAVAAPANPTKAGMTFAGWYSNEALTNFYTFSTMPASNITLYADWGTEGLAFGTYEGGYYVSAGTMDAVNVVIPRRTDGHLVSKIDAEAFRYKSGILTLSMPSSITVIGDSAFRDCSGLTSLTIPSGVTTIGDYAFKYCSGVTSFTIPSTVTSIGIEAFSYCNGLTSLTFAPTSQLTSIGASAFSDCALLTTITVPATVTTIGEFAFAYGHFTSIAVEASNTAFSSEGGVLFNKLKTLLIAYPSANAATTYAIPTGVTEIAFYAFAYSTNLTTVTIPATVATLGYDAFADCTSLSSVTFESGILLTEIGTEAFYNCSSLTSITIPSGITSIAGSAFSYCTNLATITFESVSHLTTIGSYAFSHFDGASGITIPASVTSIGDNAFSYGANLTSFTFASGSQLTTIGSYAFTNCPNLLSITIPANVATIGENAFINSGFSTLLVDGDNATFASEGGLLFNKAKTVLIAYPFGKTGSSYTIPDGVTGIGDRAFYGNTTLTDVTLSSSVTSIGTLAFYDCVNLTTFNTVSGLESIGADAFYGCLHLTSIVIPASVTYIGATAFYYWNRDGHPLTINVVAASKPAGWESSWNHGGGTVVWNYGS